MGIAWLLLRRTFTERPKRTILFLLGYAVATAVMITLLAVGDAVLQQAQDKDLFGGGDIILVPQGIDVESLKTGGLSALYFSIPQGKFLVRQMLQSSRFRDQIEATSPYLFSKLLYARKTGGQPTGAGLTDASLHTVQAVFADGSLPDQEQKVKRVSLPWSNNKDDELWLNSTGPEFYTSIDHFHLPSVKTADLDRWAEWHYFNFNGPDFHGYLSIMVAGNVLAGKGQWIVSLQLVDGEERRFASVSPARQADLPLQTLRYRAGTSTNVSFAEDHYAIRFNFVDKQPVNGELEFYPRPNLYFPPAELVRTGALESGYVIPAVKGSFRGSVQVGSKRYDFTNLNGYHDHNWGIWQRVEWNWGHAFSTETIQDYSMFFGEIFVAGTSKGVFVGLFDKNGYLALFRPEAIEFSDYREQNGLRIPMKLQFRQQRQYTSINTTGTAESVVTSAVEDDPGLFFVQYRMKYEIELMVDGQKVSFPAIGNAETYVRKHKDIKR